VAFITRSELASFEFFAETQLRKSAPAVAQTTIFLSHSHLDWDLVKAAINFFASHGVSVYVDWLDGGMPAQTSKATAVLLKDHIERHKKFVLLATGNSLSSVWVPWELGIADGLKRDSHMAVLPVVEKGSGFAGNEYVNLYPQIQSTEGKWAVYPTDGSPASWLKDWLAK
jgi:hypothetical protein